MQDSDLTSNLKMLGLTEYQARSLLALMSMGVGTPRDVARESGIPYPSAYDSLKALAQSGWVEFASTRPSIYRVREPSLMKEKISHNVSNLFQKLQHQYDNIRDESSKLALIYTIVGEGNVRAKLLELLDSTRSEIMAVIPSSFMIGKEVNLGSNSELTRSLGQLSSQNHVKIKLITDSGFAGLNGIKSSQVRVRDSVLAVDLLVDQKKALIALPDLSACGWVDSAIIASHFAQFLDLLWEDSRPLKVAKLNSGNHRRKD